MIHSDSDMVYKWIIWLDETTVERGLHNTLFYNAVNMWFEGKDGRQWLLAADVWMWSTGMVPAWMWWYRGDEKWIGRWEVWKCGMTRERIIWM